MFMQALVEMRWLGGLPELQYCLLSFSQTFCWGPGVAVPGEMAQALLLVVGVLRAPRQPLLMAHWGLVSAVLAWEVVRVVPS